MCPAGKHYRERTGEIIYQLSIWQKVQPNSSTDPSPRTTAASTRLESGLPADEDGRMRQPMVADE